MIIITSDSIIYKYLWFSTKTPSYLFNRVRDQQRKPTVTTEERGQRRADQHYYFLSYCLEELQKGNANDLSVKNYPFKGFVVINIVILQYRYSHRCTKVRHLQNQTKRIINIGKSLRTSYRIAIVQHLLKVNSCTVTL
jgi:hypothetical protein